jgi:hypothetical protein
MPKIIEVPGVGNVEFPDGMSDEQIAAQITGQPKSSSSTAYSGDNLLTDAAAGVGNFVRGVGSGVVNTGVGAYDLARKAVPALPEVSPTLRSAAEAPNSAMGRIGKFAEQTAEFLVPGMAVSKATAAAPLLGRMAAEGATSGAVAALQTGGDSSAVVPSALFGAAAPLSGAAMGLIGRTRYPERIYQSSLKPPPGSPKVKPADVKQMVQTGLKEGIPVTEWGLDRLYGLVDDINGKIAKVIDDGEGVTISRQKVASRTRDAEKTFAKQVNNESDLAAIKNSRAEFLRKHEIRAPFTKIAPSLEGPGYTPVGKGVKKYAQPIPAAEAQAEKIGTYLQLRGKYGQLGSAEVEAQKALARGLKEELAEAFPKLKELNARDSRLLQLQTALERATKRINNREQLPIGSVTLSTIKSIVDSPTIKSHLAIALARAGDKNAPRTVSRGMAALNALLQETVVSTTPQ